MRTFWVKKLDLGNETFIELRLSYAEFSVYSVIVVILLCDQEFSERNCRTAKK